ncbi:MAG: hypothetical protein ABJA57_10635 [Ginsengibacter sp.]
MKNWNKICGFLSFFLLTAFFCSAQVPDLQKLPQNIQSGSASLLPAKGTISSTWQYLHITPNYTSEHFGFFCKKELAAEKFTKIPFKIRLGSLQQCNYLEGKEGYFHNTGN